MEQQNKNTQKRKYDNWSAAAYKSEPMQEPKERPAPEPLTPKQKRENFWFYYKYHVLIGIAVLVVIVTSIIEIVNRPKYDMKIVMVTDNTTTQSQEEALADFFEQYIYDYDGNGEVSIGFELQNLPLSGNIDEDEDKAQMIEAMQTRFLAELSVGTLSVYVMDARIYEYYSLNDGTMRSLEEEYGDFENVRGDKFDIADVLPEEAAHMSEYLYNTDIFKDCFICQRDPQYMNGYLRKDSVKKSFEQEKEFLNNLITNNIVSPKPTESESSAAE